MRVSVGRVVMCRTITEILKKKERERETEAREHGRRRCVHDLVVQRVTTKEIEEEEEGGGREEKNT